MWRGFFCCLLFAATTSCQAESVEKQFFKEGFAHRTERLETHPLEEQWRIFLYGNQVVHPPLKDLALPIAKRGKLALDYVLQQLGQTREELNFRDSLVVFDRMQQGGYYDVCGDAVAMEAIRNNESKISHPDWRGVYSQMLKDLCRQTAQPEKIR